MPTKRTLEWRDDVTMPRALYTALCPEPSRQVSQTSSKKVMVPLAVGINYHAGHCYWNT